MINFNKTSSAPRVEVSTKRTSHKRRPIQRKNKLTKNNKEFLKLVGLLK